MTTRHHTAQPTMALAALVTLLLALLALTAIPAQAANNYNFPDHLPPNCTDNSNGNYSCGALTLGAGDIITVSSPATVTVSGAMTIGANTSINATGSASSLNFQVKGAFSLGDDSTLHANISTGESAANIGGHTEIVGDISTGNGVVTTLTFVKMTGNITTTGSTTGTVNIGADNIIAGYISTPSLASSRQPPERR